MNELREVEPVTFILFKEVICFFWVFFLGFQAIPVPTEEVPLADEAQAAKRRCLPSAPAPPPETSVKTTSHPVCPITSAPVEAAQGDRLNTPQTSQHLSQLSLVPQNAPYPTNSVQTEPETPMDTNFTLADTVIESSLLTPQINPFQSTLNSDPLLSVPSPPLSLQHSYTPSSGFVSYMETLFYSHFPQDDGSGPLY